MDLNPPAIASLSNGEIAIAVVCAALIGFSLVVSMVIPKRYPNFPGKRNLLAFTVVAVAFVGGMLAIVEIYGGEEAEEAEAAEVGDAEPSQPAEPAAPAGGEESPTPAAPPPPDLPGDPIAGAPLFASAGCGGCHTLADAGTSGTIGPNLDESQPDFGLAVERITNGTSVMPAYAGQSDATEIDDLAAYVVAATAG